MPALYLYVSKRGDTVDREWEAPVAELQEC